MNSFLNQLDNPCLVNHFDASQLNSVKTLLAQSGRKMVNDDEIAKCILYGSLDPFLPWVPSCFPSSQTQVKDSLVLNDSLDIKSNTRGILDDLFGNSILPVAVESERNLNLKTGNSTISKDKNISTSSLVDDILGSLIPTEKKSIEIPKNTNTSIDDILGSLLNQNEKQNSNESKNSKNKTQETLDFLLGPIASQPKELYTQNIQQDSLFAIPCTQNGHSSTADILESVLNSSFVPSYSVAQPDSLSSHPVQDSVNSQEKQEYIPIGELKGKTTSLYERLGKTNPKKKQQEQDVVIPCTPPPKNDVSPHEMQLNEIASTPKSTLQSTLQSNLNSTLKITPKTTTKRKNTSDPPENEKKIKTSSKELIENAIELEKLENTSIQDDFISTALPKTIIEWVDLKPRTYNKSALDSITNNQDIPNFKTFKKVDFIKSTRLPMDGYYIEGRKNQEPSESHSRNGRHWYEDV